MTGGIATRCRNPAPVSPCIVAARKAQRLVIYLIFNIYLIMTAFGDQVKCTLSELHRDRKRNSLDAFQVSGR